MRFKPSTFAAVLFGSATLSSAVLGADTGASRQQPEGIWKAVVPPKTMKGEFNNFDPLGVAAGARIPADCSLNWVDPDDGKLYCFVSGTSLEFFLDSPKAHIQQARAGWLKLGSSSP